MSREEKRSIAAKIARLRERIKTAPWYEGESARLASIMLGLLDLLEDEL